MCQRRDNLTTWSRVPASRSRPAAPAPTSTPAPAATRTLAAAPGRVRAAVAATTAAGSLRATTLLRWWFLAQRSSTPTAAVTAEPHVAAITRTTISLLRMRSVFYGYLFCEPEFEHLRLNYIFMTINLCYRYILEPDKILLQYLLIINSIL